MILSIQEYISSVGKGDRHPEYLFRLSQSPSVKECGMLKWKDSDACIWAGPFEGNFVYFDIQRYKSKDLSSIEDMKKREEAFRKEHKGFEGELRWHKEGCTKEMPVMLYLCGNDDTSYSKMFKDVCQAKKYLSFLEKENNNKVLKRDFVFTN